MANVQQKKPCSEEQCHTSWVVTAQDTAQDTTHDNAHDAIQDEDKLIEYCVVPRSKQEIMDYMGFVNRHYFSDRYLKPLLQSGRLVMTLPDKPTSKNQKYVKGK